MININVIVKEKKWFKFLKNPENYLKKKIKKIQKDKIFKKNVKFNFSILLSNSNSIRLLNKKFRKKNKSTDVLSFPFQTKKEFKRLLKKNKEIYIGDIIVNLNKIKNKKSLKVFKMEFDRLWIHGLVHLFGHDHKKEKDYLKMSKAEKKYINFINA